MYWFPVYHLRCMKFKPLVIWIWNQNIAISTVVGTSSHIIPFYFVIATTILVSTTCVNSESCKRQECDVTETVPLIDDQKAPLTVSIDMSNVNKRVTQFIEEAIETKMSNLTKTKLEDVLASLKLEKALGKYIEDLQDNLIINITTDIQEIVQRQIKLSKTYICFLLSNNEEKFLSELILWHCFMQSAFQRIKGKQGSH